MLSPALYVLALASIIDFGKDMKLHPQIELVQLATIAQMI